MPSSYPNPDHELQGPATAQPLVSVVTPVHNGADYLADCIRSVLAQSYPAWEYIIVNNASTDGSLEIARSFAEHDPRIRIVNTERLLPQTVNFNFALSQISPQSRYCKMVLADDWIYPNCLQAMVALAETDPEIALVGAFQLRTDSVVKGTGLACDGPHKTTSVLCGRDACRPFFLNGSYVFGSPSSVLYAADLVRSRDPFFSVSGTGYFQDAQLCFEILRSRKFGFVHQILTYIRYDNVSIGTSIRTFHPGSLTQYVITKKYGRCYLTESEYRRCWARVDREYYGMLASSLVHRVGPDFWRYHTQGVELVGERLDWGRITRLQFPRLLNLLGNPKRAIEGLLERLRSTNESGRVSLTN